MKATLPPVRAACCVLSLFIGLGIAAASHAEELEKTPAQWIEQLRSDDFDQRRAAVERLEKLGEAARAALDRAAKDDDAEVRTSALKLLAKLSKATLQLRVCDAEGKALGGAAGIIVMGGPNAADQGWQQNEMPVKLDAEGRAGIKLQALGLVRFQLKFPGFLSDGTWSAVESHAGINAVLVKLMRGGALSGSVADADGKPLKEAKISLYSGVHFDADLLELQLLYQAQVSNGAINVNPILNKNAGAMPRTVDAGGDGKWQVQNVPAGVYTCVAQAPGHIPALGPMVRIREGSTLAVPLIILKERHAGKVVLHLKRADGKPRANEAVSVFAIPLYPPTLKPSLQAALRNIPMHNDPKETDENGTLQIEDLTPGKYQLVVTAEPDNKGENGGTLVQAEIDMKPGETLTVEQNHATINVANKGTIRGLVVSPDGKIVQNIIAAVIKEEDLNDTQNTSLPQGNQQKETSNEIVPYAKGRYRLENIIPGKYAIRFKSLSSTNDPFLSRAERNDERLAYVFGIAVEAGKETVVPEVMLTLENGAKTTEFKGRVLLADGTPASNSSLQFYSTHLNATFSTGNDGTFKYMIDQAPKRADGSSPVPGTFKEYLFIRHLNFKPLMVQSPFVNGRDYQLELQEYGTLRAAVMDENGKPLAGVKIAPVGETRDASGETLSAPSAVTNVKGLARLTGLASGPRELTVSAKGYFLPAHAGRVNIAPNQDTEIKITLHAGAGVQGRVMLPAGYPPESALATMDDWHFEPVNANGECIFSGVTPGEHTFSAVAPGLVAQSAFVFTLPDDPEKIHAALPRNAAVAMVRPGGVAIDCGREYAGCSAQLVPAAALDAAGPPPVVLNSAEGFVDADGRAEFWNIAPGLYQFSVLYGDLYAAAPGWDLQANPAAGPIEVKPLESPAQLAALEAVKVNLKRGTATVSGRIRIAPIPLKNVSGGIALKLRGAHATAEGDLEDEIERYWQTVEAPLIIGKPPENFKPHMPGTFEISLLPAGEYKIFASLNIDEEDEANASHNELPQQLIAAFKIKDGETLNLGDLKFEPLEHRPGKPIDFSKSFMLPQDRSQEFEP